MPQAGKMRSKVTIEKPLRVANALGEIPLSAAANWAAIADVRCQIIPLRSAEVVRARQAQLDQTHTVRMRYFAALTADCRLRWDQPDGSTRFLNIVGIINLEELNYEHELQCAESSGAGGTGV